MAKKKAAGGAAAKAKKGAKGKKEEDEEKAQQQQAEAEAETSKAAEILAALDDPQKQEETPVDTPAETPGAYEHPAPSFPVPEPAPAPAHDDMFNFGGEQPASGADPMWDFAAEENHAQMQFGGPGDGGAFGGGANNNTMFDFGLPSIPSHDPSGYGASGNDFSWEQSPKRQAQPIPSPRASPSRFAQQLPPASPARSATQLQKSPARVPLQLNSPAKQHAAFPVSPSRAPIHIPQEPRAPSPPSLARNADKIVQDYAPDPRQWHDRLINVRAPIDKLPGDEEFFRRGSSGNLKPDVAFLRRHFHGEGKISEHHAMWILERAGEIFSSEPNVVDLPSPITICGDIHGQYYDLMKLFEVGGSPSRTRYLFLGDYVDRGSFGIECVLYMFCLKIWYPDTFFMLRGNHESRHLTEYFTFKLECKRKYSERFYDTCMRVFDLLPLAAIVNKQFYCSHGGLSPSMTTVDDLRVIDRFKEPPNQGIMCDVLWSDPAEDAIDTKGADFIPNPARGCSYYYSYEVVCKFLKRNKLLSVIRAHEAQKDGYRMYKKTPHGFPSVITVFSAPNYLDAYQNKAAVIIYDQKLTVRQFTHQAHPYVLPNFMDAFTWTLPFVAQKVSDMFIGLLTTISSDEMEAEEAQSENLSAEEIYQRRKQLQQKMDEVGKMNKVFALLREESERVSELKRLEGGTYENEENEALLMEGLLELGSEGVKKAIKNFDDARKADFDNERAPPELSNHIGTTSTAPSNRRRSVEHTLKLIQQVMNNDRI